MGLRSWMCAIVVLTALVIAACNSPGTPFTYKDVKVSIGPTATPSQPVVNQATTIRFTVRNTWNEALTGVAWELRRTSAPAATIASGTTDLIAFGSSAHEFIITNPILKGTYSYEVVVDPLNLITEQDETNNTSSTLTVLVADQNIGFDTVTAPTVTWPAMGMGMGLPHVGDAHTLTFTITNTLNPAQLTPASPISVPFTITRNDVAATYTATPASPTVAAQIGVIPGSTAVSVVLPATGSAGTFVYNITLSPEVGDDNNNTNNTFSVTVTIPASS